MQTFPVSESSCRFGFTSRSPRPEDQNRSSPTTGFVLAFTMAILMFVLPNAANAIIIEIDIEKLVNGIDADTAAEAPTIPVGDTVTYTYTVTNIGTTDFTESDISVTDNIAGINPVRVDDGNSNSVLEPNETWIYEATPVAMVGLRMNIGTVTALGVTDSDPAYYIGVDSAAVPEPAVVLFLGLGLAGLSIARRRQRNP